MASAKEHSATLQDLSAVRGKAELIDGEILYLPPAGYLPCRVAGQIFRRLADDADSAGHGEAFMGTVGYVAPQLRSGRQSFCPDASYYDGPSDDAMGFIKGPPTFAVEVRSQGDYGPAAERKMADKRADYFEAGRQVVWDVDPVAECVHVYRAESPDDPVTYWRGQVADAESAVPGWSVSLDWIFG